MFNITVTVSDAEAARKFSLRHNLKARYLFTYFGYYVMECQTKNGYLRVAISEKGKKFELSQSRAEFVFGDHREEENLLLDLKVHPDYQYIVEDPEKLIETIYYSQNLSIKAFELEKQASLAKKIYCDLMRDRVIKSEKTEEKQDWIYAYSVACLAIQYYYEKKYYKKTPALIVVANVNDTRPITDCILTLSKVCLQNNISNQSYSVVYKKSKYQYCCDVRLAVFMEHLKNSEEIINNITYKKLMQENILHGSAELFCYPEAQPIHKKINVPKNCNWHCPQYNKCRYQQLKKRLWKSRYDFLVCSHYDYLIDRHLKSQSRKGTLPDYSAIMVDDVDKLYEKYESMFNKEFTEECLSIRCSIGKGII